MANEPGPAATPRLTADVWFTPGRFAALLGLFLALTFPKVILGRETFFYRDFGAFTYPVAQYFRDCFWRGELPLWNPLNNFGTPLLAQWNPAILYPPSLFYLIFPLSWSLGVFNLAHLFLAGMGMYFLARRWTGNQFAAAVAGMTFAFNGLNWHMLMWISNLAACAWMPWVVLTAERAWREGGRWIVWAALAGAMQMLTGSPEIISLTWIFLGALWLVQFVWDGCSRSRMTGRAALVILLVAGLAAAQLLPFMELLAHSQRDASFDGSKWAMPMSGPANFLVPLFHCYNASQGVFVQYDQYWIASYYVGAGLLVLAAAGTWGARNRRVWLLTGVVVFSVWMALGDAGHLYSWLKTAVPPLGVLRYPIKFVVLTVFAIPLLAAFGVSWEQSNAGESERSLKTMRNVALAFVVFVGLITFLAWRHPLVRDNWPATWHNALSRALFVVTVPGLLFALSRAREFRLRTWLAVGLLLVLWLDVYTHAPSPSPAMNRSVYEPGLIRAELKLGGDQTDASRFMETRAVMDKVRYLSLKDPANDYLCRRLALFDNCNLLDGLPKADGFYSLYLRDVFQITCLLYSADGTNVDLNGLEDFLGISHINVQSSDPGKLLDWVARPSYLPLFTAGQKPVFAAQSNIWPQLLSQEFKPRETVYLPPEAESSITARRTEAKIISTHFQAQHLEAEVDASAPAMLVVAQSFYKPWHAYVDGARVPLWEANGAFQALQVPAGRHQVKLAYEDAAFNYGLVISLASLAVVIGLAAARIYKLC